jgi:hypothetical protein
MRHALAAGRQLAFQAKLETWAEGMDYCAVPIPAEIIEALGTKGPVLVMARVNESTAFQVSLFPVGGGQHYIRIKANVRKETGTKVGDQINIQITVLDRAQVDIPEDLINALRADNAEGAFKSLSPGKQNFIVRRINEATKPQTREKRIQEALETARGAA